MAYVIKVEYEGSLRRLLASRAEKEDLSLTKVEARVRDLFKLPSTAQLKMTYKDKENDVVTVACDQDLTDACVTQKINPLYIRVAVVPAKAAQNMSASPPPPVTSAANAVKASSSQEPVKESSTPEKSLKKTVKIVDPVFQRIMPPNQVPQMMENIVKMVTTQMHAAKKMETNPKSGGPCPPNQSTEVKDPTTAEEKKAEDNLQVNKLQATHKGVRCNICQMNPIVGPRFKALRKLNYDLCGRCYTKAGNANDYQRCEHSETHPNCAGTSSVKLVHRMSPAVAMVRPVGFRATPVLVVRHGGARCIQVKTC
ncbi:hypothetical protein Mapa_015630 [Marchantia paleacea]|nr:hypothetical protein Mapa_015630 [Marchantia paleacea]